MNRDELKQSAFDFLADPVGSEQVDPNAGCERPPAVREPGWRPAVREFGGAPEQPDDGLAGIEDISRLEAEAKRCTRCVLRSGCNGVVFGEGNRNADVMLVGEGPGAQEDLEGRPFVGAAGQLLDRILKASGFERSTVYITNVVMCRPPLNRLPLPDEVRSCKPFLVAKLRIIKPKIVVCLGALATQTLVDPLARITQVRGRPVKKDGIIYLPTYHPAALLRDASKKRPVWEDFQLLKRLLE